MKTLLFPPLTAAAALLCLAPSPLSAADRFWNTASGGLFTNNLWALTEGGAGGASPPGVADIANFTLNNTYTITFASDPVNTALHVENGIVTFALNNRTYSLTSAGGLEIGNVPGQTGRLTVKEGTLGVDTGGEDLVLGNVAGSTGFLTITTSGSLGTAALRPDLYTGYNGAGTLTVNDNGRVDGRQFNVGLQTGSTGTAAITGPNAAADFTDVTLIGGTGTGTVNVTSGGTLTSALSATLGGSLGGDGTATVSGSGSSWTMASTSTVGSAGDGTLTISSGGLVSTTGAVTLGNLATGFGTATVTGAGSRWNLSGFQTVGGAGLGVVTVSGGGQLVSSSSALIGGAGGEGRVTVTGAGSRWSLGSSITVGVAGAGDLTVSAGGEVSAASVAFGNNSTGRGVATVTGTGSKLTTTGNVTVANVGDGTLNVASGAEVYVGSSLTVSDPSAAPLGTLNLDGGSIFVAGAFTNIGVFNFTDGLLQVAGNFQPHAAANPFTINGSYNGDLPALDLIGTGATTNLTSLTVGSSRRGQLLLRQGRVLDLVNNNITIGFLTGSEGIVSVQSGAQLLTSGSLALGGFSSTAGGTGTLSISGGTVRTGQLRLFADGTVNLNGGTLAVASVPVLDGQLNWTGGTLRFDAAFALTGSNVPKLLGLDATLNAGQALTSNAAVTLQTPLVVDGGALNASNLINQSRLEVRSGSLGTVQNDGLLIGDGLITGAVTNNAAGRIRVDAGDTLFFTGTFSPNAGQLNLQGGTLDFTGAITNSATGFITGRGALFTAGLTNNGQMAFSGGNADIFGDVTLTAGSRVVTSGANSVTTFWDDVTHNGTEIFTGVNCSTVFFGGQSGAGTYTGSGTIYFIGDLRPGSSPAVINFAPQVVFAPSNSLTMEIGGLAAGTQHDKLNFTHAGTPQVEWGGTLVVELINGFTPAAGQTFDVLDFDAARDAGTFSTIIVLDHGLLPPDVAFDFSELYTTGIIRVVSTTGTTFAQWAATELGSPGALPQGDHNNNGYDNLTEYALALLPPFPGAAGPSGGLHVYPEGERMRVQFWRHIDRTDITIRVQASTDLVAWDDLAVSVNSAPFTGAGFVSENRAHPLSEPGLVEVRDTVNTSAGARRFLRILVTLAP